METTQKKPRVRRSRKAKTVTQPEVVQQTVDTVLITRPEPEKVEKPTQGETKQSLTQIIESRQGKIACAVSAIIGGLAVIIFVCAL